MKGLCMPNTSTILIHFVPENSQDIKDFLVESVPEEQKGFCFNVANFTKINCFNYIIHLREVAIRITERFSINHMRITNNEFCKLINSSRRIKNIEFNWCIIITNEECEFAITQECFINSLKFEYTGDVNHSSWIEYPNRFSNILTGISNCNRIRNSLKKIYINNCDIAKEEGINLLNRFELAQIEFVY